MKDGWGRGRVSLVLAVAAATCLVASVAMATSTGGGGAGNANEMKPWDCSNTPCGTAGNGSCASTQTMCCCPSGSPPTWSASCKSADCDGQTNCQTCQ
jgi:hypothetical protein